MAKQEKPLEYEPRVRDTKGLAQRMDLDYLRKSSRFRDLRRRMTWIAPWVALAALAPFFWRGGEKFYASGPVSRGHAMFEGKCSSCHAQAFAQVGDSSCKRCHDGPIHQPNAIGEVRCAECHVEHRGELRLADISDRNCTRCHGDLASHARNQRLKANRVLAFRPGGHPEFSAAARPDQRPLKLNHAIHMPAQPKVIGGKKLPMSCGDCHATDRQSPTGDLVPVAFEQNCRSCHQRELEFDVYQLLGDQAPPAPHTKDPQTIHDFILKSYQALYSANPAIAQRPLGQELTPVANAAAWLTRVVSDSEQFLFQRKCRYCHEYESVSSGYPVVKKVNLIRGRYVAAQVGGEPWLLHSQFSHRAHRAVACASCHVAAMKSTATSDVLVPKMESCLPCHSRSKTRQDRCVQCHVYHDKSRELERDRRPVEQLTRLLSIRP